ncbi:MAG: glycosyl hydrolase family 28 protein [Ignavibacteriaceae bacterium]|jgi:polygalacturonase
MKNYYKYIFLLINCFIYLLAENQFCQSVHPNDFIDQFDVSRNKDIISNTVTLAGISDNSSISVSGGSYSVNGSDFTTEPGSVNNNDQVKVLLISSKDYGTVTTSNILIGNTAATFSVRTEDSPDSGWVQEPNIIANVNPPVFPDTEFVITDYGAAGDGITVCTQAFRDAITAGNEAGGGRVVVPEGIFLTGAIHLESNVNLYVSKNAVIKFSQNYSDYLPVVYTRFEGTECYNYSPLIYAFEQKNIAVTGQGTLDGQGDNNHWWPWKSIASSDINQLVQQAEDGTPVENRIYGEGHYLRPNMIQPYRCSNVLIDSVTVINSPMWHIHPVLCENVTISNVTIEGHGPNNDGCDPESCKDVLIKNCSFNTGDDCIAIKSGRNADGRRVNVPAENIVIKDCTMKDGHGGIVLGSEISGSARNIFASDCYMDSPNLDRALRIKTNSLRGGTVENIYLKNITVGTVSDAAIRINYFYGEGDAAEFTPVVRNIEIRDMVCQQSKYAFRFEGYERSKISDIRLINCDFNASSNSILNNIENMVLNNVDINNVAYNKILQPSGEDLVSVRSLQNTDRFPGAVKLMQNYPNPFNPETKIKFIIPDRIRDDNITLKIFDILGREITTLVNEKLQPGQYVADFDNSKLNLSGGVYFYNLKTSGFSITKKMIVLP